MFGELFAAVCVLAAAAAACPSHELESDQKTYDAKVKALTLNNETLIEGKFLCFKLA